MPVRIQKRKWHYRFQVEGRTYYGPTGLAGTARNKIVAMRIETEVRRAVLDGRADTLKLDARPFDEAAELFLKWAEGEHRDRPATARRLAVSFTSLKAFFGTRIVHTISPGLVEDYKSTRRTKHEVRDVTLRHDLHALSKFFRYAIKHNWARENPVSQVSIPSDADAIRMHVLTEEEEFRYFEAAKRYPNLYDVARLILLQGMRPEEVMTLRQEDVDFGKGRLFIRRGKTAAARRTLKLRPETLTILQKRCDGGDWVFPGKKAGNPITKLNNSHEKVLSATSLRFVLYDLRHTFATRTAQRGVDLATLAAILGHSGIRLVQRYVHVTQAHQDAAMEAAETLHDDLRFKAGIQLIH